MKSGVRHDSDRTGVDVFLRQIQAVINRQDSRGKLATVECPTLVLCGRRDNPCPVDVSEELANKIPGAYLIILETCGHISTKEKVTQALIGGIRSKKA